MQSATPSGRRSRHVHAHVQLRPGHGENRLTLLNASREGPEVCIGEETFRKARAGGWGLASRQSRCWARLSRQVKKSLKVEDKRVNEAEKVLFTAAKKLGNPRLAALASRVRLDAFSKVP